MISISKIVVIALHWALVFATSATQYEPVANTAPQADYGAQASYGGGGDYKQEEKHAYAPYGFGYNVDDGYGSKQWRHEKSSSPHQVVGSYGYQDKDGIMRQVEYVADKNGFRAVIKTNEPGTAPKDPAYVKMEANPVTVDYQPKKESYGKESYGKDSYGKESYGKAQQGGAGGEQYGGNSYSSGGGKMYEASKVTSKYLTESSAYGKSLESYGNEYAGSDTSAVKVAPKYTDKK